MAREYLGKTDGHEIWIENGIVYCSSEAIELTQEHVNWIFKVIGDQFAKMRRKRKLIMLVLKGTVSVSADKYQSRVELSRMGTEKLAIVIGKSRIAEVILNFAIRMTPQGNLKTKVFENNIEARKWLLEE